jgi:hypothetical protein
LHQKKPRSKAQSPRCFNADELQAEWQGLREDYRIHLASKVAQIDAVKGDTAKFFNEVCHLKPFAYQLELAELYRKNQFLAVRWPRQTGKSTSIGGLLMQDAYETPDLNIGFIGPSYRQTKLNLRRVAGFCRNLPAGTCHIQRTRISFKTAPSSKPSQTTLTQSEATPSIGYGGTKPTSPQATTTSTTQSYSRWEPQTAN